MRTGKSTTFHTLQLFETNDQLFAAPTGRRPQVITLYAGTARGLLGRLHFHYFRHVVLQKILDAHLERGGRARAARAGPLHVQVDHAILEILEDDVAAVLGNRRTHARFEKLLDLGDDLVVIGRGALGGRLRLAHDHRL